MNNKNKLIFVFLSVFSSCIFAASSCSPATAVSSPGFCKSFGDAAKCHCRSAGLPEGMCKNYKLLYNRMINIYGSVERACRAQHETTVEECMNDWACFLDGGQTASGEICSGTGESCAHA